MGNTFLLILITSIWTVGLFLATGEGQLLNSVKVHLENAFGSIANPIIACVYCMPSLHGAIIVLAWHYLKNYWPDWYLILLQWLFVVVGTSLLNYIIYNLIRILKAYAGFLEAPQEPCAEVSGIDYKIENE